MSVSQVTLCNRALRLLAGGSIGSFEEGSDLAGTCSLLYETTANGVMAAYPWRHSMTKARLARLADAPLAEWQYQHALPTNLLLLRRLASSSAVNAPTLADYEMFDGRVLSNQLELWADYQVMTDPATWPPAFYQLMMYALASDLALAVTESANRADHWRRVAYGTPQEGGNGGQMAVARRLDAQQQPAQGLEDFPLIVARFGHG